MECVNKDRQHNKTEALNFHQWHVRMASEYAVTQCTTQILEDIIRSRNKEGTGDGDGEGILWKKGHLNDLITFHVQKAVENDTFFVCELRSTCK